MLLLIAMHTANLQTLLKDLGLSHHEAIVYQALLGHGAMSISHISAVTHIKRTSLYQYVDNLLLKDYIVRIPRGKRMFYGANNPEKILRKLKKQEKDFTNLLPELLDKYGLSYNQPNVRVYSGKSEFDTLYEEISNSVLGELRSFFSPKAFFTCYDDSTSDFEGLISERNIKHFELIADDGYVDKWLKLRKHSAKKQVGVSKILPKDTVFTTDTLIYNNTVVLFSFQNITAVVIENEAIAEFFRSIHKLLWKKV